MKRIWSIYFICSFFISGAYCPAYSDGQQTVYFYNTESNINNFAALKGGFDIYLENRGGYFFQPFDLRENFEAHIREKKRGNIYVLSNWHLRELQKKKMPLEIAMIGTLKGNEEHRKVLMAKKEIVDFAGLKDTVVAAAGTEQYVHNILKQILGKEHEALLEDITIFIVPKDLDALLSVGFDFSSAAVSAENGIDKMKLMNPDHFEALHPLGFSKKDYLLVVATLKNPTEQELQLLEALRKMQDTDEGKEVLRLIGIDGWRKVK